MAIPRASMPPRRLPLPAEAAFPAGVPGVRAETIPLRTGVRLRVARSGDASAPAVILLHGWAASMYMHRRPLTQLPAAGFQALAVDLRGHGWSDKPMAPGSYTLDSYLDDLMSLMDHLGLRSAHLVGQSMGGAISLHAALRYPDRVRSVTAINPAGLIRLPYPRLAALVSQRLIDAAAPWLVRRWLTAWVLRRVAYGNAALVTEQDVDEYWAPAQFPEYARAARALLTEFDWQPLSTDQLQAIKAPVQLVLGRGDRLIRGTQQKLDPRLRLKVVVLDGGHCVNEERPDELVRLVADFARQADRHVEEETAQAGGAGARGDPGEVQ
jgi:pimeloyl-ACP methyl ester carboxylesterase